MWKFLSGSKIKYISAIVFSILLHYTCYDSKFIHSIDYKSYDVSRVIFEKFDRKSIIDDNSSSNTIIVNIDEKSLQSVGQWPWSRNIDAELIHKINSMNPAAIAMNIIFSELDRTSPVAMDMPWDGLSSDSQNYDKLLMNSIAQSNTILSVYLHDQSSMPSCNKTLYKRLRFQYLIDKIEDKPSILCNHKELQQSIKNFGFINIGVDKDSFLRRVSFFMNYNGVVIPSFALAILLSLDKDIAIDENNRLQLLNNSIQMNDDMEVLLNFYRSRPKVISAIDLLEGKINPNILKGKIVLVGLSIIGSNNIYPISTDIKMSNMEIQATFIENLLDEVLLVQPNIYQKINILISFFFSSLLLYFLLKRYYIMILLTLFTLVIGIFLYLYIFYIQGIYISIGYFWLPFLYSLFLISILFFVMNIREKNEFYSELKKSHLETVESISLVVAIKDGDTGEHIQRTKNYVKILAEYLYQINEYQDILNENYILYLCEAAPLHDIGKIGVHNNIFKKDSKLTLDEYKVMQEHPILAKAVFEKAMKFYDKNIFLEMAYNIAYYYHERWDGQGYPLGLSGNQIPLEAQIMALSDVYDSLISKHYSEDGYDYEKVEETIIEGRGTAFNPKLVDAFIELKEEFREIHKIWKDDKTLR